MKRFFRILHWRARAKFWQRKYQTAFAEVRHLRAELNAEMNRNREREDTFVSASVMGSRGMYGVAPRSGPARQRMNQTAAVPAYSADPWDGLSWADKQEFELYWVKDAEAAGKTRAQARQDFMNELASRKTLNDDFAQ